MASRWPLILPESVLTLSAAAPGHLSFFLKLLAKLYRLLKALYLDELLTSLGLLALLKITECLIVLSLLELLSALNFLESGHLRSWF